MKYVVALVLVVLVLLSFAAGGAKALNMPQEVQFFEEAGLSSSLLLPLGIIQILGGLLSIFRLRRRIGAVVMAFGFLFSAIAIFLTSNAVFGLISLLPVALSLFIAWKAGSQPAVG